MTCQMFYANAIVNIFFVKDPAVINARHLILDDLKLLLKDINYICNQCDWPLTEDDGTAETI